jgi:hypothetical protein
MLRRLLLLFFLFWVFNSFCQEKKAYDIKDRISVSGFIKYMSTTSIVDFDSIITDNLIHNRVRFKWDITGRLQSVIEVRNRVFYGKATRLNPYLGEFLDHDIGQVDLSFVPINKKSTVVHSILDRAYLKYSQDKWELRMGRQRINWGVNLAFNPNDLFNAYSLVDFDYQERPGADALRFQYFTSDLSSIEFAIQPNVNLDSSIIAGLWKFNKWKYDFQLLVGNYYEDITIGSAWAGNIKNTGFKTEFSYFYPKFNFSDNSPALSLSTTLDYSFKNGIYINGSVLYNSLGIDQPLNSNNLFQAIIGDISAKSLMPSKWTYFGQVSGVFNPALNGSLSVFYMQGVNLLLFMPSMVYNISDNWELMITAQSALGEINSKFKPTGTGLFVRLMYSF